MQQKQIHLFFLIIGISTLFFSCDKGEVEYFLKTDFNYINETDSEIIIPILHPEKGQMNLNIQPKSVKNQIFIASSGGYENPTPSNCCQGIVEGMFGGVTKGFTAVIDSVYCTLKSPRDINNYESEVIADRHYKYTFTFTDSVLEEKDCN